MAEDRQSDVWQRLLELAERPRGTGSPAAGSPRTTPASTDAPGPGHGGTGNLKQSNGPWTSAAGVADDLAGSMQTAKNRLGTSHGDVGAEGAGLASIAALHTVRRSWERRLGDARKECESLGGKLRQVAKEHDENETATKSSFERLGR
ncbi:hypothetical protein ACGRHY_04015 [Streptomyces sp. HK10]|uniref:hypothetical protein n=1 Tax=Streptomyces sp. HK10 TaxID=3373255 RepID=UPI0037486F23